MPSATRRATSNSRAVSGRHGSSSAPRPRAIASSSSARSRSGRLPSASARSATPRMIGTASASRFARRWHAARSSRAQRPSQVRPSVSQPVIAASSAERAATVDPALVRSNPSAWSSAGRACVGQSARSAARRSRQRSASSGRRAASAARVPVTTKGRQQRPLAGGLGEVRGRTAVHERRLRVSAEQRALRQAPASRQDEVRGAARQAGGERPVEELDGPFELAAAERHEGERVECGERAAQAAWLHQLDLGRGTRLVPAALGPQHLGRDRAHHMAAVRLLDLVGVAQALLEADRVTR